MLFLLLNFLTSFLAFVAFFVVLYSKKKNHNLNIYFLIILFFLGIQRFLYSTILLFNPEKYRLFSNASFGYILIPIFLLFIKKYIGKSISTKENIFHILLGLIFFLSHNFFELHKLLKQYLFLVFTTCYLIVLLLLLIKFYRSKDYLKMNRAKKRWLFIMILIILLIFVVSNYAFLKNGDKTFLVVKEYYNITAILWLTSLIYLFFNPEILYGKEKLKHIVNNEDLAILSVWKLKPVGKIAPMDKTIHNNIAKNAIDIIKKIENFGAKYYIENKDVLNFDTLVEGIGIQAYHLNYIFKYYCIYNKSDFFNYCKIMYAVALIEKGYLTNKTINSLITETHFNSKKTFYTNFKKFTNKNPHEIKKILQFKV